MKKLLDITITLDRGQERFLIKRKGQVNTAGNFFNVFRDNDQIKMLINELLDRNLLTSTTEPTLVNFTAKRTVFTIVLEQIRSNIPECDYQIFIRAFYLTRNLPKTILNKDLSTFTCYDITDFEIPFLIKPRQGDQKEGPYNHEEVLFHFWTSKHVLETKKAYANKFNLQRAASDIMKHLIINNQLEQMSDSSPFHVTAKEVNTNSDATSTKLIFSVSITKSTHNEKPSFDFLVDDIEINTPIVRGHINLIGEPMLNLTVDLTCKKPLILQEKPKGLTIVKKVAK